MLSPFVPFVVVPLAWNWQWLFVLSACSPASATRCYARVSCAPASLLTPFTYLTMVWATLFGYLVFDQFPDAISFVGMDDNRRERRDARVIERGARAAPGVP